MSTIRGLHSHSALERELNLPKDIVLVDARFERAFVNAKYTVTPVRYGQTDYVKVPVLAFVKFGGKFKNVMV